MWQDYEATYRDALQDPSFLAWREMGARRKAENIARVCRSLAPDSVLEVGCGTGAVLRALAAMNFAKRYFCADLSPSAVAFARDSCPAFAGHALAGQAEALAFPDGAFNVVILSHVIEHMPDPLSALREAARVARFVVVEVPTEKVFINLIRTKLLRQPYPSAAEAGHLQFWSPHSIARFLVGAGFEIMARHQDLLDEDENAADSNRRAIKHILKRSLRRVVSPSLYAILVTTHAVFLCRKPDGARKLAQSAPHREFAAMRG